MFLVNKKKISFLKTLAVIIILAFTTLHFSSDINLHNSDLGRHIKNGEIFLKKGIIIDTNYYSYTYPDHNTINHHWLAGVFFYIIWKNFGFLGLSIFNLLMYLAVVYVILKTSTLNNDLLPSLVSLFVLIPLLVIRKEVRPDVFSYLFFAVYFYLLSRRKLGITSRNTIFVLLPLIQILWVNTHIFFIFGLFLMPVFCAHYYIANKKSEFKETLLLFFITVAASLINPHHILGLAEPFRIMHVQGIPVYENLSFLEMFSYDSLSIMYIIHIYIIVLIVGLYYLISEKKNLSHFFLYGLPLTFGILSTFIFRLLSLFVLASAPFLSEVLSWIGSKLPRLKMREDLRKWHTTVLIFLILLIVTLPTKVGLGVSDDQFGVVDYVRKNGLDGPIFNTFNNGSFLIFTLYPEYEVFFDNRPEAYPPHFKQDYMNSYIISEGWEVYESKYGFKTLIIDKIFGNEYQENFIKNRENDGWILVFEDEYEYILTRN